MFYWLAQWLEFEGIFNVFRYLSFRSGAAVATALFIGMAFDHRLIVAVGQKPRGLAVQCGAARGRQVGLVHLEQHPVADGLLEIGR